MPYKLLSKISPQYNNTGFVNNINLSSYQGESLQIPGFGKIATNNTFYLPLHGGVTSPYLQNKHVHENETNPVKMEVDSLPETLPKSQTGFGTSSVLESLNQGQKHKLEDNVYSAMTSPVIKIKKIKYDPSILEPATAVVKNEENAATAVVKKEKYETRSAQKGKGGKNNQSHKFKVI